MKFLRYLLGVVLVGVVGWLGTGISVVQPGEKAVVRRFGKVIHQALGSGLYVGLPWGIDQVDRVQVRRKRKVTIGYVPQPLDEDDPFPVTPPEGQYLTGDHNLINVQAAIYYSVDPENVVQFVVERDNIPTIVAQVGSSVLLEWTATQKVDDIILLNQQAEGLIDVLEEKTAKRIAAYNLGIEIQSAQVTILSPPDAVKPAFEAVTAAEARKETKISRAERNSRLQISEARAENLRVKAIALQEKANTIRKAETDADVFLQALAKHREALKTDPDHLETYRREELLKLFRTGLLTFRETSKKEVLIQVQGP
ncbi:MAG: SPFH domain-containing protein [Gemmataceae bacterium]